MEEIDFGLTPKEILSLDSQAANVICEGGSEGQAG